MARKADRLGLAPGPLKAWVTFFEHWQEEMIMADVAHEPVKTAMSRIRELSADEEARRVSFVRERALLDEATLLKEAREEGLEEGREEGRERALRETARNMLLHTEMDDAMITRISGLSEGDVAELRRRVRSGAR